MSANSPAQGSWVYLDIEHALAQIGDMDALRDMLPMLLELLQRDVPLIAEHFSRGEIPPANALLHSIKGCMPIFCKSDLCQELAKLEHDTKPGVCDHAQSSYAVLMPKLQVLQAEVEQYLAQAA